MNSAENIKWPSYVELLPVIIQSCIDGKVLMMGYMNQDSLKVTLDEGYVCFYSRKRKELWRKGSVSGNFLKMKRLMFDCDQDTILIKAIPSGPTCHLGPESCFDKEKTPPDIMGKIESIIDIKSKNPSASSYTCQLLLEKKSRIAQKIGEEGVELAIASIERNKERIIEETSDLLYHVLVNLRSNKIEWKEVKDCLQKRSINFLGL